MSLALTGGTPVRRAGSWPTWPNATGIELNLLGEVLDNHRWTLRSGWVNDRPTKERVFAARFAAFNKSPYCVTAPSGSLALLLALEALDIGAGDEVIIPALTWVATAISVLNVNAIPVMVDVDPDTYCISPDAIRDAINPRTKCILPVHWHSNIADMDAIMKISAASNLLVLEDCAQAHGARWNGHNVGTIGHAGAFSMHNDKLLTCGEGGAILTSSKEINKRLQALRLDGFDYSEKPKNTIEGFYELAEVSKVMGSSCCLSEFQAAVLIGQLDQLANQNTIREQNATYLNSLLMQIEGLTPPKRQSQMELQTFYEYSIRYRAEAFAGCNIYTICRAVSAELGFHVYPETDPLHRSELYKPHTKRRYFGNLNSLNINNYHFPVAERAPKELMLFHHSVLLGSRRDMEDIASAFLKIQKHANELIAIQDIVDDLID